MRTWKPTAAGTINVICGTFLLIGSIALLSARGTPTATSFAGYIMYSMGQSGTPDPTYANTALAAIAIAGIIAGIVSVLGGVYSIRRRLWGMALAGSLSTLVYLLVLGVPAILLTAMSKREFS